MVRKPPAIQQGEVAIVFWRKDGQSFYRPIAEASASLPTSFSPEFVL
jgi:hypothetical protein